MHSSRQLMYKFELAVSPDAKYLGVLALDKAWISTVDVLYLDWKPIF